METALRPAPRVFLRLALFALLAAFGLIGTAIWWKKLFFVVSLAFFCGTYRIARLLEGNFERRMVILFIPCRWKRWPLERFVEIEVLYESPFNLRLLPLAIFDLWSVVMFRFFDWLVPWFGGAYKLRLRPAKGPRVVVWQGNSDANFQANVDLLRSQTGLPICRRE